MRNRITKGSPEDHSWIVFNSVERRSLRELAKSTRLKDRTLCLDWLYEGRDEPTNLDFVIELAECLAWDRRENVRWYACAQILDQYPEEYPDKIWPVILRLGMTRSPDLRSAVAVCLLERTLEHHYDEYFPKVRRQIEAGDRKMLEMLALCYYVGESACHLEEIHGALTENHASVTWTGPGVTISLQSLDELDELVEAPQDSIRALSDLRGTLQTRERHPDGANGP